MSEYELQINECLLGLQSGEREKLIALLDLTINPISSTAEAGLATKFGNDDILIDIYERVLYNIDSFTSEMNGFEWLCRIAEMTAESYNIRALQRIPSGGINAILCDSNKQPPRPSLLSAVKKLRKKDKTAVFNLFFFGDTYDEIAQMMGVSKTTLSKRFRRIAHRLMPYASENN